MNAKQMGMFSIMMLVFAVSNAYVLYRLWQLIPATAPALRIATMVAGVVLTAFFFLGMAMRSGGAPVWMVSTFYRIGTGWTIVFFYALMIFLLGDVLRLVHILPHKVMLYNWTSLAILAVGLTGIFVYANINYHNKRRVELTVKAPVNQPVKVIAVSDLHLGFGIGAREFGRWVDMINAERPDIVVFAGDVIDTGTRPLWKGDFTAQFERLQAPMGIFAALGNHEYIAGADESVRFLRHAGITVLRDSIALPVSGLAIVGRDDRSNERRRSLDTLVAGLPTGTATLLLDHQPYNLDEAAANGITLQISGHTHRGQVWPASLITDRLFERSHGEYQKGGTRYFITQGLGLWGGKFRLGTRSEYVVINFVPTK